MARSLSYSLPSAWLSLMASDASLDEPWIVVVADFVDLGAVRRTGGGMFSLIGDRC